MQNNRILKVKNELWLQKISDQGDSMIQKYFIYVLFEKEDYRKYILKLVKCKQ